MQIRLTKREVELFELLLASLKFKGAETIVRVAGGWVRDKILNQQSVDIDLALNDQSGVEFASNVNEYLKHIGMETRTIAVIQANPDQSKHLETANLRVLGYEIDCVNLRAETYTDSRIPVIRKGTALEDALRRDFTINSLFYNINTKSVEDLTGRGLSDLSSGIIRTPISAHITFHDDPLRVLRAVRFASRFNFRLDSELVDAASSPEIHDAINKKVSRERVYKECEGCMTKENSRPFLAFTLMARLGLLDAVLPLRSILEGITLTPSSATLVSPSEEEFMQRWLRKSLENLKGLNLLITLRQRQQIQRQKMLEQQQLNEQQEQQSHPEQAKLELQSVEYSFPTLQSTSEMHITAEEQSTPKYGTSVKVLYWAGMTSALGGLQVIEKQKTVPLIPVLLRDGLKMENSTMKSVQTMVESTEHFRSLAIANNFPIEEAGNVLRTCKELWRDCVLLASAQDLAQLHSQNSAEQDQNERESGVKRSCSGVVTGASDRVFEKPVFEDHTLSSEEADVVRRYGDLINKIVEMGLDNVWELKPLMNGSELIKQLGLPKGPMVGKLVEQQTLWQIRNPGNTDREACLGHLRSILPTIM